MDNIMETKQQVTKKLIVGAALVIFSLIIGKILIIPIFIYDTGSKEWWTYLILYAVSWLILIAGIVVAGWEGYKLAVHRYKEIKRKSFDKVKQHSTNAAKKVGQQSKKAVKSVGRSSRNAVNKVKEQSMKAKNAMMRKKQEEKQN